MCEENIKNANIMKDLFDQIFQVNNVNAKTVDYIIGNNTTTLLVHIKDKNLLKQFPKMVSKLSAACEGYTMTFIEEFPNSVYSGIEFPNIIGHSIDYEELVQEMDVNKGVTAFPLGKMLNGNNLYVEIKELHNALIGGGPGSGKTNLLNNIISTMLKRTSPAEVRLVLIDPTHFEMNVYKDDPHLLCPVVIDPATCTEVLKSLKNMMNDRYEKFEQSHSRNIEEYNAWAQKHNHDRMPYAIVILNEYSIFSIYVKQHSFLLTALLQKSYACGIHVIISTQNAQSYKLPNIVKNNLVTRICFETSNLFDSINVLGEEGAEKLMGSSGNLLIKSPVVNNNKVIRIDDPYISTETVYEAVKYSKEKYKGFVDNSLTIKVESNPIIEDMKETFLNMDSINDINIGRVELWAYEQEEITSEKIKNELGVNEEEANNFLKMLYDKGVIIKTDNSNVYKVIGD